MADQAVDKTKWALIVDQTINRMSDFILKEEILPLYNKVFTWLGISGTFLTVFCSRTDTGKTTGLKGEGKMSAEPAGKINDYKKY